MRALSVLLTNDDGIDAPGLEALRKAIPTDWTVFIAAPALPMSECGHRITTSSPVTVTRLEGSVYAVDGTPADCVRLAVTQLMPRRPDWVFAGINHGGNLGADIYPSGTLAAVREGVFLGIPGLALSHFKRRHLEFDWRWAASCARVVIGQTMDSALAPGEFWNVNLPHLDTSNGIPEIADCLPSKCPLPVRFEPRPLNDSQTSYRYTGVYPEREREAGSDVDVCFGGRISRSKLRL